MQKTCYLPCYHNGGAHLGAKCNALLVALTVILINHGALKRRVSLFFSLGMKKMKVSHKCI